MTMSKVEVSDLKFPNFQAKMEASACYLEIDDHLLLIQQATGMPEEGRWGIPAGRLELNETPEVAAKRELFEETGIKIQAPSQIQYLGTLYIRKPELDYVYYMFRIHLGEKPSLRLSFEHNSYRWANAEDLENFSLRTGVKEALQYYKSCDTLPSRDQ